MISRLIAVAFLAFLAASLPACGGDPDHDGGATADGGAAPGDAASPEDVPEAPACLELPAATGAGVTFTKAPYLQAPTETSMVVAFETIEEVAGQVAVWRDGEDCLDALVATTPTRIDTWIPELDAHGLDAFGLQHAAAITGLTAGTRYQYQVVVGGTVTEQHAFQTAPARGTGYTAIVFGDNRTFDEDHQAVVDAAAVHEATIVVNTGDAISFGGVPEDWDMFFAIEGELLADAPLMPIFGNHEAALGQAFWKGFIHVPNAYDETKLDYAFAYGDSYWLMFDANKAVEGDRLEWVKARLADSEAYPFRFVAFHHPFYTFSKHVPSVDERDKLHPLFVQHGVTAVWNGHNHCYERFMVDGIPYIVAGGGGSSLYSTDSHIVPDEQPLRVMASSTHHYIVLSVQGDKAVATVYDTDNNDSELDSWEMLPATP